MKTNVVSDYIIQLSKIKITKLVAFEINSNTVIFLFMKVVLFKVHMLEPHCLGFIQFCHLLARCCWINYLTSCVLQFPLENEGINSTHLKSLL